METERELQSTGTVKDTATHTKSKSSVKPPSLSFIIAKTILNNPDGMTTRDISAHIMRTYSRYRSMDLNVFVKSVGSDISRSEFYYKKSKGSKNTPLWAVLPKYESYLKEMTGTIYQHSWKDPHKSKTRQRKSKPTDINNCVASFELCEDIKTEEPEGYNDDPMSSEEAIIPQFNEMNSAVHFKEFLNFLQQQANPQEQDSGIYEQENADVQSENSNDYMNQNYSEQIMDAFTSANTNNILLEHTTMQDVHPSVLEEIKFINIPTNTSENFNTPMSTSEMHSVDNKREMLFCPVCKLPFFTYEDLGKHVHCEHTGGEIPSSIDQNGVLREVLSKLMTALENLKSNTPIELSIVTGNQNVYMTADPEKQGKTFSSLPKFL